MTCTEADIIATTLLAWDDELSKELVELVNSKNTFIEERAKLKADELTSWKEFWEQRNWLRLKADSADMKIRQIVNYKILSWDYKAQAYQKLAKEMIESWENAWATIDLLRKIDATDIKEYDEIFRVAWWFDKENPVEFVNWVRDIVANSWATLYEQEDVAKELLVKKMEWQWASSEEITAAIKDLMWQDKDLISRWLTPHNFSKPDAEWTTIKNTVSDPEEQFRRRWQYCLGKAIIGRVNNKVLKEINKIVKAENTVWKLTAQQIDSTNTLEELMARAYTNTQDLVEDWLLRDSFSNRISQLLANKQITDKELEFWEDLIRVSRFAEEWAAFSKIVLYKAVKDEAEKLWIKVGNPKKFTENIYKTIKDDKFLSKIDDKGMVTMADDTKIAANDLLVLLTLATWDKRIPRLLRSWEFSDSSILWIATQVALGNSETATRKIIQLIGKVKEMPNLWDSKDLALMTLCWSKIQPWAKKWYFDYRSMYKTTDIAPDTMLKADFEEKMANANRAEVFVDWLTDLTNEKDLATKLADEYSWGYIIVNDSWWRNNKEFAWALDAANSKLDPDKQITVLYPRQSQMSNFVFENGRLIFRSRDSRAFREIMDKVSLRTMWDADATRILRSLAYEMETWKDWTHLMFMKRYWAKDFNEFIKLANLEGKVWELWRKMRDKLEDKDVDIFRDDGWIGIEFNGTTSAYLVNSVESLKAYFKEYWIDANVIDNFDKYLLENWAPGYTSKTDDKFFSLKTKDAIAKVEASWLSPKDKEKVIFNINRYNWKWTLGKNFSVAIEQGNLSLKDIETFLKKNWAKEDLNVLQDFIDETIRGIQYYIKHPSEAEDEYIDDIIEFIKDEADYSNKNPLDKDFIFNIFSRVENIEDENIWMWTSDMAKILRLGKKTESLDRLWEVFARITREKNLLDGEIDEAMKNYPKWFWDWFEVSEQLESGDSKQLRYCVFEDTDVYDESIYKLLWYEPENIPYSIRQNFRKINHSLFSVNDEAYFIHRFIKDLLWQWEYWRVIKSEWDAVRTMVISDLVENINAISGWRDAVRKLKEIFPKGSEEYDDIFRGIGAIKKIDGYTPNKTKLQYELFKDRTRSWGISAYKYIQKSSDTIDNIRESWFIGKPFEDVARAIYSDWWYLPIEIWFAVDKETWNVGEVYLWSWMHTRTNWAGMAETISYHNHPNWSYFSGSGPDESFWDIASFASKENETWMWLILPWDVIVVINKDESIPWFYEKIAEREKHWREDQFWDYDYANTIIQLAYKLKTLWQDVLSQKWWVYEDWVKMLIDNNWEMNVDILEEFRKRNKEVAESMMNKQIELLTREWDFHPSFQRVTKELEKQPDVDVSEAMKVDLFTKDRTFEDIAKMYNIPIEILKWTDLIAWVRAYWAYGDWIIYFTELVKKWTAPHELFHAVFDIVDKKTKDDIIATSQKLFGYTEEEANEKLADAFSEWFLTWDFKYSNLKNLKKKEQNSFFNKVKEFFKEIKKLWNDEVDMHKKEVSKLFQDIVDWKYVPNSLERVSKAKAAWEYTKELEESANRYFAAMLWENDWANPNYRDVLHAKLEEMTWIPIKSLRDLNSVDKNKLWQAVNTQFTNAQRTTWKFKSEIIDITETIDNIESLTLEWVKEMLNNTLDWMVNNNEITEDKLPYIKQSLEELETASTIEEWLEAKGRLLALANGWNAERFTLDELVTIFTNGTYEQEYKQMFFPNQDLTEEELKKYVSWINNMIFDWLTVSLSSNLVKQWYALPLESVREVVIDYLTWNLDTKSNFAKAFLYKNWLPDSNQVFKSVVQSAMPTDLKLGYEDAMYKLTDTKPSWKISRITVEDNPFLPDTYSSLASIVNAKTWVIQVNSEAKYLWNLLDKYEQVIKERLKNWISFEEAQQLKTQLWYALDIFEQDIVMAKYGKFLTPQQKSAIRNMKSYIAIVVGKEWEWTVWSQLTKLEEVNKNIMNSFTTWLEEVVDKYSALRTALAKWDEKAIAKLQDQMKANGTVMANVDWEIVVIDARENIKKNLQNLPESIKWFGWISTVDEITIDNLDGPSAYYLNSLIEAAKKLDALAKWEPAMMYHIDPELNMVRFFDTFKLVDYWVWEKIPAALVGNILSWSKELSKFSLAWIDDKMKLEIFKSIKGTFQLEHTLSVDKLWEIINKAIERNDSLLRNSFDTTNVKEIEEYKQLVFNQYQQAFMPYTHLRDIPSGWAELWLKWVKEKINEILTNEIGKVREALDWMPGNYAEALNSVSITTPTWQSITLNEFLNWVSPNWKKAIFDDESIIVKSIDELNAKTPENNSPKEIARVEELNKEYSKKIVNQYNEVLQAIQNQQQVVSEAERHLASRMLNNARSIAQKYSLTNRLVETSNMVWGLEEEAARMMKYWLVWFKSDLTFWRYWSDKVLKRLKDTQDAYKVFYTKSLEEVNNIKPKNEAEELAKHLCKYFKTIEWHLGSVDWVTWVTTRPDINRAFYNIWEVFMNIDSVKWVFAFMSAVEENQFLKFFKFSNPNQASYVKEFTRPATLATEDIIWGYREYVTKMPDNINKDLFNEIFAANFTDTEFKSLYQALSWLTYVWWRWKTLNRFLWFVNGTTYIGRLLVSYPWQLFTIPQQWIAYFLKQKAQERRLWESDFSEIDRIRSKYWTLDKAYNEFNLFRIASPDDTNLESYYNRYWVPDINDVYRNASLSTVDDVNDMYAKIANYQSTWDNTGKLMRSVDAYKDNANNIIDWLFARNFKNIAFLKAIRENAFMQFWSAQAFEEFMMNNAVDKQIKKQLMDAVNASAWRNFRNILWLGFWWLDRAVGWNAISNTAYWLMQMLNFRWAWWQNIFKQTWETLMTLAKMSKMWWTPEGREAIALYVARTPEFTNFVSTLANDLAWMWKLQRYQDNGRWNELEDEYDVIDFLEYTTEIFNMSSQWFQWILSFWPIRPVMEQIGSAWNSLRNPEIYKDTLWVWAFFNALGKNAWRNWKPRNWIFQAMQALEEWWPEWFWAFFQNQFWKLSFWSMRYMMDEDANNYGYTYDLINDEWWIPSIFRWEAEIGSDKSFSYALSNNNTWNAMIQWFNDENLWEDRKTYLWDWWLAILNGSNLFNATKNAVKAIPVYGEDIADAVWLGKRIQPFTMNSFVDVISKTRAWDELIRTWRIIPKTPLEMKAFVEEFVDAWNDSANRSNLKPYGSNFAKAIMNFHQFWHANWEKPHSNDAELEIMLNDIRYVKGADWKPTKQETQFWTNMVNYIVNHPADMDTTSRLISQDVFQWLEDNNDNPNYLMYQSLVGQGMVDWYLDSAWTRFQNDWNSLYWGKKAAQKISKEDWIKSWLYWWDFMTYLLNSKLPWSEKPLVEYLQELDRKTAMDANLKIIKNQMTSDLDRKQLEHYVSFKTDSYGNEYTEINSQYASQLKAFGWMWDAIEKWDIDLLVARMSRYANEYINTKKDPTWLNTATTLLSLVNRVRESNLAPDLKIKMMSALAENNIEFLQKNVDVMREIFWDDLADAFISAWNELIYWIDWAVNSTIWEALMNWDGDAVKSWTGLSNKIKNCLSAYTSPNSKYWASWDWFGWRSWDTAERVPYVLDIAKLLDATWGKWYSPKIEDIKIYTSRKAPDLSIAKDVKRNTKAYNSQEVSKKKVVL